MSRVKNLMFPLLLLASLFASCTEGSREKENRVDFASDSVSCSSTGQFISILTSGEWTAEIPQGEGADWCRIVPASGKGKNTGVMLTYSRNEGKEDRVAHIHFTFSGQKKIVKILVQGHDEVEEEDPETGLPDSWNLVSDRVNRWMELPVVNVQEGFAYIAHYAALGNGSRVRNYSYLYDAKNRISRWVAYPLTPAYTEKNQKRTDEFGYDPKIPEEYQPDLGDRSWPTRGYDRGHQLPSGSRTCSWTMNAQTFYNTNMTAQKSAFNQKIWAKTEGIVRTYLGTCDTLYVVTGPVLQTEDDPQISYIKDVSGRKVALPKAYFKVLLKYRVVGQPSGQKDTLYSSIGFWFRHEAYSRESPNASDLKSVAEIEKLTGLKFFDNLPDRIEETVKNQFDPEKWAF